LRFGPSISSLSLSVQRPVILPPLEAGGIRCSVKPASRIAHLSRCRDAEAFAKAHTAHYATLKGRARRVQPQVKDEEDLAIALTSKFAT